MSMNENLDLLESVNSMPPSLAIKSYKAFRAECGNLSHVQVVAILKAIDLHHDYKINTNDACVLIAGACNEEKVFDLIKTFLNAP